MIMAVDGHGVIGLENAQPWRADAHQRLVREITYRSPVILGRNTWEAVVEQAAAVDKPVLAQRVPIILSTTLDNATHEEIVAATPEQALDAAAGLGGVAYILGGASTFEVFSPWADMVHLTRIPGCFPGDTFMERRWLAGFELVDWALADDESVEFETFVRTRGDGHA